MKRSMHETCTGREISAINGTNVPKTHVFRVFFLISAADLSENRRYFYTSIYKLEYLTV